VVLCVGVVLPQSQFAARPLILNFHLGVGTGPPLDVLGARSRPAGGAPAPDPPPPELGADNALILKELGYDPDAIGELKRLGVI
jgi:crotonobetainyl-CoA:carnitine CoA-transferase CaiB-like acyl-CoA transferase